MNAAAADAARVGFGPSPAFARAPRYEQSFEALMTSVFAEDYQRLVGFARLLGCERHRAEEIVMDAFVNTLRVRGRSQMGRQHLRCYLARAVKNACSSRHKRLAVEEVGNRRWTELRISVAVDDPIERDRVVQALKRLPPKQREAVCLHYYLDMSIEEIAVALDKCPGTVKRALFDARERLKRELGVDD